MFFVGTVAEFKEWMAQLIERHGGKTPIFLLSEKRDNR